MAVGISASSRTPYVITAVREARRPLRHVGVRRVQRGLGCRQGADIAIDVVVGTEFVAGSIRLKAGIAQKLVLSMLTTLAMVCSNKSYGNRMVDVRATNAKLVAQAFSLVQDITIAADPAVDAGVGDVYVGVPALTERSWSQLGSFVRDDVVVLDGVAAPGVHPAVLSALAVPDRERPDAAKAMIRLEHSRERFAGLPLPEVGGQPRPVGRSRCSWRRRGGTVGRWRSCRGICRRTLAWRCWEPFLRPIVPPRPAP